jgi:hypothetical protein
MDIGRSNPVASAARTSALGAITGKPVSSLWSHPEDAFVAVFGSTDTAARD